MFPWVCVEDPYWLITFLLRRDYHHLHQFPMKITHGWRYFANRIISRMTRAYSLTHLSTIVDVTTFRKVALMLDANSRSSAVFPAIYSHWKLYHVASRVSSMLEFEDWIFGAKVEKLRFIFWKNKQTCKDLKILRAMC